jgi:hypothetical protein
MPGRQIRHEMYTPRSHSGRESRQSSSSASAPASINSLVNRFILFPGLLVRPLLHAFAQNSIDSLLSDQPDFENRLFSRQRQILTGQFRTRLADE